MQERIADYFKTQQVYKMKLRLLFTLCMACAIMQQADAQDVDGTLKAKPASQQTVEKNKAWYSRLDFKDSTELQNANRGLIEATPDLVISNAAGEVWNMADFKFVPISTSLNRKR